MLLAYISKRSNRQAPRERAKVVGPQNDRVGTTIQSKAGAHRSKGKGDVGTSSLEALPSTRHERLAANQASIEVWENFGAFQVFDAAGDSWLATTRVAKAQEALIHKLKGHRAPCPYLAVAAFLHESAIGVMAKEDMPVVQNLNAFLDRWSRRQEASYTIFDLELVEGVASLREKLVRSRNTDSWWNFLVVDTVLDGRPARHVLPLVRPDRKAIVTVDVLFPDQANTESEVFKEAEAQIGRIGDTSPAVADGQSVKLQETAVVEPHAYWRSCLAADPGLNGLRLLLQARDHLGSAADDGFDIIERPEGGNRDTSVLFDEGVIPGFGETTSLFYEGVYPPPPNLGLIWQDGWWPVFRPKGQKTRALLPTAPAICSATAEQAGRWGSSVLYWPVPEQLPVDRPGPRGLASGSASTQFFQAGDSVRIGGIEFVPEEVRYCGERFLRLFRSEPTTALTAKLDWITSAVYRDAWYPLRAAFSSVSPEAVVITANDSIAITAELQSRVDFATGLQVLPPEHQAGYNQCRNQAAALGYKGDAPSARSAAIVTQRSLKAWQRGEFSYAGGKPFPWGYCYSCGKSLPGRFPGRLCGCSQTPAALVAAAGLHVTPLGGIVYPGVVQTMTRHPPLKQKKTLATSQCFREPL